MRENLILKLFRKFNHLWSSRETFCQKSATDCTWSSEDSSHKNHQGRRLSLSLNTHTHARARAHTRSSWLKEKRLHPDKREVVVQRQALVADAAELVPDERRQAVLRRRPVHRLRHEAGRHVEIRHLDGKRNGEQQVKTIKKANPVHGRVLVLP